MRYGSGAGNIDRAADGGGFGALRFPIFGAGAGFDGGFEYALGGGWVGGDRFGAFGVRAAIAFGGRREWIEYGQRRRANHWKHWAAIANFCCGADCGVVHVAGWGGDVAED